MQIRTRGPGPFVRSKMRGISKNRVIIRRFSEQRLFCAFRAIGAGGKPADRNPRRLHSSTLIEL
jgi:hypothetical protein